MAIKNRSETLRMKTDLLLIYLHYNTNFNYFKYLFVIMKIVVFI